jgi:hypothetical protein
MDLLRGRRIIQMPILYGSEENRALMYRIQHHGLVGLPPLGVIVGLQSKLRKDPALAAPGPYT